MRFTLLKGLGALCFILFFGGGALYIASDYARLQFLRAKEYFSLRELRSERESLHRTNRDLKLKVRNLSSDKARVLEYEKRIRDRLNRLAAVLHSAKSLGLFEEGDLSKLKPEDPDPKDGVGGSELDCFLSKSSDCLSSVGGKWDAASENAVIHLPEETDEKEGRDLLKLLDRYITAVRAIPFLNPTPGGRLSSRFGMRVSPFNHHWRMHEGIDISLRRGTPVFATADGIVKKVGSSGEYGLYIDVMHSPRVITRYAHLSKAVVKPERRVKGSDLIGYTGSTGRSTGPHLHYEVRVDQKAKNPQQLFALGEALRTALSASERPA